MSRPLRWNQYQHYLRARISPWRKKRQRRWFGPYILSVMLEGEGVMRPVVWLTCEEVS